MADMQTLTGRVWELDQRVILPLFRIVGGVENTGVLPLLLPFGFNFTGIVLHINQIAFLRIVSIGNKCEAELFSVRP